MMHSHKNIKLCCTDFHPNRKINVVSTDWNSFTHQSNVWFSLHWFSWNSQSPRHYMGLFYTKFHRNRRI